MSKSNDKLSTIQKKLKVAEDTDFIYLTKPVQKLRHSVLYLHTSIEASVDKRIIDHIQKITNLTAQDTQKKVDLSYNLRQILNEIDFSRKLKIVTEQKSLSKEVIKKLYAVNDLRVHFAHPTSYRAKLISYQRADNLLKAYVTLDSALEALKEAGIEDRPLVLYMK